MAFFSYLFITQKFDLTGFWIECSKEVLLRQSPFTFSVHYFSSSYGGFHSLMGISWQKVIFKLTFVSLFGFFWENDGLRLCTALDSLGPPRTSTFISTDSTTTSNVQILIKTCHFQWNFPWMTLLFHVGLCCCTSRVLFFGQSMSMW